MQKSKPLDGATMKTLRNVKMECSFPRLAIETLSSSYLSIKQGHALKNCVEGVSDEAFYPWESPKKIRLKSVKPTFVTEQKKF